MRKRFVVKLAVTITALSAMTLLQGCGGEEDGSILSYAWGPVGSTPLAGFFNPGAPGGVAGGTGQSASSATANAVASAAGGGGGQVSGGGVP